LLVKLHEARSVQEEDEILRKEIGRQKELMMVKGQSTVGIGHTVPRRS
jgi:hypothetical protein